MERSERVQCRERLQRCAAESSNTGAVLERLYKLFAWSAQALSNQPANKPVLSFQGV